MYQTMELQTFSLFDTALCTRLDVMEWNVLNEIPSCNEYYFDRSGVCFLIKFLLEIF